MTSPDDRMNNGQVDPRKVGTNGSGPAAARPGPSMGVEGRADQAQDSVQRGAGGEERSPRGAGRQAARRTEQLVILSVAIVLGGVGFAFHPLWIAAVVVMALLWGYMASEMRSQGGGVVSDVVETVVSEAKEVGKGASAEVSARDQGPPPVLCRVLRRTTAQCSIKTAWAKAPRPSRLIVRRLHWGPPMITSPPKESFTPRLKMLTSKAGQA